MGVESRAGEIVAAVEVLFLLALAMTEGVGWSTIRDWGWFVRT